MSSKSNRLLAAAVAAVLLLGALPYSPARAQATTVVINEIVADNTSTVDGFGATPDWIELRNLGATTVDLAGWTIGDDATNWTLPSISLAPGARVLLWASDRDLAGPEYHTNFRLTSSGETVRLARPDGSLADTVTYPPLAEDRAYGRDSSGALGFLINPTPGAANSALAPGTVSIDTPAQVFTNSIQVALSADLVGDQRIRYTTDGNAVTASSPIAGATLTFTQSTVLRTAVESGGVLGPEATAGYIEVSSALSSSSSDLPIVLVQASGPVGNTDRSAIVTVIDRSADGRAYVLGDADYTGFAGLRIRGDSSSNFPKKQYKFELWENPNGTSRDGTLLGIGQDDDWGLYAPGRFDRAMIQNPLIYELGDQVGVPAPGYQFVELWLEDQPGNPVGTGDYQGLYLLRETIEIDDDRVDITKHTPTSAGPDGGYIIRQDRPDSCCVTLRSLGDVSGGVVAIDQPTASEVTSGQISYIDGWWDDMRDAAATRNLAQIEQYIDLDAFIDYWLVVMISADPDAWRLSTYFFKDAGGTLGGGPLWDYDRTMGSADGRNNDLSEAVGWVSNQHHTNLLISFDFVDDLWKVPEIQARLRARWIELRNGAFSDAAITAITDGFLAEITESYARELTVWNGNGYGPRQGNGIAGEIGYTRQWLQIRLDWLDTTLGGGTQPSLTNPGTVVAAEGTPLTVDLVVSGGSAFAWSHTDLPAGLTLDQNGRINGIVALGDAETKSVTVTVTNESGGQDSVTFDIAITPSFTGPAAIVLNEYNAVEPGRYLDSAGTDTTFGRVPGNGGDWFELVTIDDHLDLRGWQFDIFTNDIDRVRQTASLRLNDDPRLQDIRAGTIITIAESVPDDLSYDPLNDDWTLHLQANTAQAGALWANQTNFDTNNTKWRLVVRDAGGTIRAPIAGETEPWDDANFGVSAGEIMHLAANPTATPDLITDYTDGTNSTFGHPNPLPDGGTQDLSSLRPELRGDGNVNCDAAPDITDALLIAQYSVGLRTDGGQCPLPDPQTQLLAARADFNGDGTINIVDALAISQCTVGIDPLGLCEN